MRRKSEESRAIEARIKRAEDDWKKRRFEATPLDILMHRKALKDMNARKRRVSQKLRASGNASTQIDLEGKKAN